MLVNELFQDAKGSTDGVPRAVNGVQGLPNGAFRLMAVYWNSTRDGESVGTVAEYDAARAFCGYVRGDAGRLPAQNVRHAGRGGAGIKCRASIRSTGARMLPVPRTRPAWTRVAARVPALLTTSQLRLFVAPDRSIGQVQTVNISVTEKMHKNCIAAPLVGCAGGRTES